MTALFGHMGIEADVRDFSEADQERLTEAIALYKRLRPLLHSGRTLRIDVADPGARAFVVVGEAGALVSYAQVETPLLAAPAPLRVPGLSAETPYRVTLLNPSRRAQLAAKSVPPLVAGQPVSASGALISGMGLALPILRAGEVAVIQLEPVG
jgi:alpha-galactosidase